MILILLHLIGQQGGDIIKQSYSQTGELYICDGNSFVLKVSDNEWVEFRSFVFWGSTYL